MKPVEWVFYKFRNLITRFTGGGSMQVDGHTFTYTGKDGAKAELTIPTPKNGVSVTDAEFNDRNELEVYLSNGEVKNAGKIEFTVSPPTTSAITGTAKGKSCEITMTGSIKRIATFKLAAYDLILAVTGTIGAGEEIPLRKESLTLEKRALNMDGAIIYYLQQGLTIKIASNGQVTLIGGAEDLVCESLELQVHRTFNYA